MNISLMAVFAKRLMAVCVVSLIVWHVTHFGSAPRGKAIVYASRPNDVVVVNDHDYLVESLERPLVCNLESGKHLLRVKRGQLLIAEEEFTIEPDKEVILIPRVRINLASPRTPPKPDLEPANHAGLAIRAVRFQPTPN